LIVGLKYLGEKIVEKSCFPRDFGHRERVAKSKAEG
jgi:hypothetical protein